MKNNMQLNAKKTKEMCFNFSKTPCDFPPIIVDDTPIEKVHESKLLGVTINDSLTWESHIYSIIKRASKRIYYIILLKRSGIAASDIFQVYGSLLRPLVEYCCQVWHFRLTKALSSQLEGLQKRKCRKVYTDLSYEQCLSITGLPRLEDRRELLCLNYFRKVTDPSHKLFNLLPPKRSYKYNIRSKHIFERYKCRTNRFKCSFLPASLSMFDK